MGYDRPDGESNGFVINYKCQNVASDRRAGNARRARIFNSEIDIHPHPLRHAVLMRMNADAGNEDHVAQKHMTQLAGSTGDPDLFHGRLAFQVVAHSGVAQTGDLARACCSPG